MIKFLVKKIEILLLLFISTSAFCQNVYKIDYYGVISSEIDENMYKMTSDLYYTQLCEINIFNVEDKRTNEHLSKTPDVTLLSDNSLCFYAVITKKEGSNKWCATLNLINKNSNSTHSETKEYDSYYKILMEPKEVLQDSIKNLITNNSTVSLSTGNTESKASFTSTENLSGTWTGEKGINKIVIMRGGRGFVIFDNGASMNITVEIKDNGALVLITQNGNSNASFFPDLPREIALTAAINAKPITWKFNVTDTNTLTGNKNTLTKDGDSVKETSLNVTWKRKL